MVGASTEDQRFGETAVALGLISREELYDRIGDQVRAIFYAVLQVADGSFYFSEGFDEGKLAYRVNVEIDSLLMDAMSHLDPAQEQSEGPMSSGAASGSFASAVFGQPSVLEVADVVGIFNEALLLVHHTASKHNFQGDICSQLAQFAQDNPILMALGPARRTNCTLNEAVSACMEQHSLNLDEVSRALRDCATFGVFLVESWLHDSDAQRGAAVAAELSRSVAELTMPLAPEP